MLKHTDRVRIEEVDWPAVFPWVKLLGAFKMAVHPSKLFTSLLLVVLIYLLALVIDPLAGRGVHRGELPQYRAIRTGIGGETGFAKWVESRDQVVRETLRELLRSTAGFKGDADALTQDPSPQSRVRQALSEHYAKAYADLELDRRQTGFEKDWEQDFRTVRRLRQTALATVDELTPGGPLMTARDEALHALNRLARSVVTFNFGWSQLVQSTQPGTDPQNRSPDSDNTAIEVVDVRLPYHELPYHDPTTTFAALHDLLVIIPGWLWHHHRLPLLLLALFSLPLAAILGGAVARMAALHATRDERIGLREALRFVLPRWWGFLLTPLVPPLLLLAVATLMGLGGFLIFNPPAWGIDILGGLLFGIALLCGLIIAATLLLTAMGIHLVYPASAVNGSDVFDAVARAFNYVLNRPWRWLFYNVIAILHGALMYLFLSLVVMVIAGATRQGVGQWVFTTTDLGVNRFEAILPEPGGAGGPGDGVFPRGVDYASLDWSGRIAAFLVHCWMGLLVAVPPAFAVSHYLSVNTWIYTLLRRDADGIELEDVLIDPPFDPSAPPRSVEEAASEAANDDDAED